MAESTITGPDGAKYTITHPDNASDAQIMRYVQQQISSGDLVADQPQETAPAQQAMTPIQELEVPPEYAIEGPNALETVGGIMTNLPSSTGNVISGLWDAVTSPVETAQAVAGVVEGAGNKLGRLAAEGVSTGYNILDIGAPRYQDLEVMPGRDEGSIDAVQQHITDRYGSLEAAQETLMEDPAGLLLDVAPVAGVAGRAARSVPRMEGALPALTMTQVSPISGTSKFLGDITKGISERFRRKQLEGEIKPSTTLGWDKRNEVIETAMEYRLFPDEGGFRKAQKLADEIDLQVDDAIKRAEGNGRLSVDPVYDEIDKVRERARGNLSTGTEDLEKIDDVQLRIMTNMERLGLDDLSPTEMQGFKRDLYRDIDWKNRDRTVQNEAEIAASQGARMALEQASPELAGLNRDWGRLLEAMQPLERAGQRRANRVLNPFAMGGLRGLASETGGAIGRNVSPALGSAGNPAVAALSELGWLADIVEDEEEPIGVLAR